MAVSYHVFLKPLLVAANELAVAGDVAAQLPLLLFEPLQVRFDLGRHTGHERRFVLPSCRRAGQGRCQTLRLPTVG